MMKCLLAALLCVAASPALAERPDRDYIGTLPSGIWNNCYPQTVLPWGSCDSNRGEGRNSRGSNNEPSPDNDLPGGPNVPGGSPIPGRPGGGVVTPHVPGDDPDDPGCVSNCGPGGNPGKGNPGNDKPVGNAGENPGGNPFGPTGRRGRKN